MYVCESVALGPGATQGLLTDRWAGEGTNRDKQPETGVSGWARFYRTTLIRSSSEYWIKQITRVITAAAGSALSDDGSYLIMRQKIN